MLHVALHVVRVCLNALCSMWYCDVCSLSGFTLLYCVIHDCIVFVSYIVQFVQPCVVRPMTVYKFCTSDHCVVCTVLVSDVNVLRMIVYGVMMVHCFCDVVRWFGGLVRLFMMLLGVDSRCLCVF